MVLVAESEDAVFSIVNPVSFINMSFKVSLNFVVILEHVFFAVLHQNTLCWNFRLVDPLDGGVWKFVVVVTTFMRKEACFDSSSYVIILELLPCGVILWLFNEFLRLVVVFKLNLLHMSNLLVHVTLLLANILLLLELPPEI